MFSKKMMVVAGLIVLVTINVIILSVTSRQRHSPYGLGRSGIAVVAPFQEAFTRFIFFCRDIWGHYFYLVSVSMDNTVLKQQLHAAQEQNARYREIELANIRLRELVDFKQAMEHPVLSAEVIAKDPSPWFKSVVIDKGRADGVRVGFPVVVPLGIVGQVTEASNRYARVLLIIDQNNAVDGLVQRTRARGMVKGAAAGNCMFKYALRKHDIRVGDTIISSGLDGVFPKGIRIGSVAEVVKTHSGIFQEVSVTPFADFEKLEEVLVIINPPHEELHLR